MKELLCIFFFHIFITAYFFGTYILSSALFFIKHPYSMFFPQRNRADQVSHPHETEGKLLYVCVCMCVCVYILIITILNKRRKVERFLIECR
jgi:hypothetical protein